MPKNKYRHIIISMTDYTSFSERITRDDVEIYALHKKEGKDLAVFYRLWKLLRQLRPDIVHTRNLSALEASLVAFTAGVKHRVHGEHGRDIHDIEGKNWKYNLLRRFCQHFIHHYITVSKDLENWLIQTVRVPKSKISQIYNGVNSEKFDMVSDAHILELDTFVPKNGVLFGTVGRMEVVKDQLNLAEAFIKLIKQNPELQNNVRLALVGDGSLLSKIKERLKHVEMESLVWMPGARDDVPKIMNNIDVFVLPSLAEGISNTILEAMACGLPVIATKVGGNQELVREGYTGLLVPPSDPSALADAMASYIDNPELREIHGKAARLRIINEFSMKNMIHDYCKVYDGL